jgi:hypothetical protein
MLNELRMKDKKETFRESCHGGKDTTIFCFSNFWHKEQVARASNYFMSHLKKNENVLVSRDCNAFLSMDVAYSPKPLGSRHHKKPSKLKFRVYLYGSHPVVYTVKHTTLV